MRIDIEKLEDETSICLRNPQDCLAIICDDIVDRGLGAKVPVQIYTEQFDVAA
jgi:hypothetical protein